MKGVEKLGHEDDINMHFVSGGSCKSVSHNQAYCSPFVFATQFLRDQLEGTLLFHLNGAAFVKNIICWLNLWFQHWKCNQSYLNFRSSLLGTYLLTVLNDRRQKIKHLYYQSVSSTPFAGKRYKSSSPEYHPAGHQLDHTLLWALMGVDF